MSDKAAVIERLKALTGPDREVDCLIFEARHCLLTPERRGTYYGKPTGEYFDIDGIRLPERAPLFTESFDAAMQLVPTEHDWIVASVNGHVGGTPYACVGNEKEHFGATPVISLCIAALQAAP